MCVLCVSIWEIWEYFFLYILQRCLKSQSHFISLGDKRVVEGGQRNRHPRPPSVQSLLVSLFEILNLGRRCKLLLRAASGRGWGLEEVSTKWIGRRLIDCLFVCRSAVEGIGTEVIGRVFGFLHVTVVSCLSSTHWCTQCNMLWCSGAVTVLTCELLNGNRSGVQSWVNAVNQTLTYFLTCFTSAWGWCLSNYWPLVWPVRLHESLVGAIVIPFIIPTNTDRL